MTVNPDKIHVVVVDDNTDTLNNLKKLLYFEKDIEIVATASSGEEGVKMAKQHQPDVVLMDINMPGMDGISASEAITAQVPGVQIVIMSVQAESDYLRRAMLAGAREFLIKPFSSEQLAETLRKVYQLGASQRTTPKNMPATTGPLKPTQTQTAPLPPPPERMYTGTLSAPVHTPPPTVAPVAPVIAPSTSESGRQGKIFVVFGASGGVGRSTVACNLAIALRDETKAKIALVDCSLRFGDVGVLLNLTSNHTLADIASAEGGPDTEILVEVMSSHPSGVKVLLAPPSPELADLVTANAIKTILHTLREKFDYVVVDSFSSLDEVMLSILDSADQILLLMTTEIPTIKNTKLFFEVTEALNYPPQKTLLLLNKFDPKSAITPQDIESSIKHPIYATIERDDRATTMAAQTGQPFVVNQKNSPTTIALHRLAKLLTRPVVEPTEAAKPQPQKRGGLFR
jgi:pilus assembly protein CpaE